MPAVFGTGYGFPKVGVTRAFDAPYVAALNSQGHVVGPVTVPCTCRPRSQDDGWHWKETFQLRIDFVPDVSDTTVWNAVEDHHMATRSRVAPSRMIEPFHGLEAVSASRIVV